MNPIKRYFNLLILLLFFSISPAWAAAHFYGADINDAKWSASGNRLECQLSQFIPGYGKAAFKRRALKSMEFQILANYKPRKPDQALVFISPPIWKRYDNRQVLGRVPLQTSEAAIVVPEDWAYKVALELREGMEAAWSHADWADGKDIVTAKVLPIHFEAAWRDFQRCGQNLINYGFSDVKYSAFYYSKKGTTLNSKDKKYLDKLAEYVLLDTDFEYIQIKSHTDSRGVRGRNLAMSKRRANMVKKYLVKKGVSSKRFVILAKGEKKPKFNNRTKSGRAKNRRVEVRLVK